MPFLRLLPLAALLLGFCLTAAASPARPRDTDLTDLLGIRPPSASERAYQAGPDVLEAFGRINRYRRLAGLEPVELDARLSLGCEAHARYLTANRSHPSLRGLGVHAEQSGLPGYTLQGARAAVNSLIAPRRNLPEAVEAWMATLYHRVPVLRPNLKRIGLGHDGMWAVMDAMSGVVGDEEGHVAFPTPGQREVPTLFPNELPDPIPAAAPRPAGYPITVQFPAWGPKVTAVHAELTDAEGNRVPFHLSHPDRPACAFPQENTVCLIPVRQLAPARTFRVTVAAEYDGRPVRRSWSFTTEGQTAAAARRGRLRSEPAVAAPPRAAARP